MPSPLPRGRVTVALPFLREFAALADIAIAPARAFRTIAEHAPWRAALIVTGVLGCLGAICVVPAQIHVDLLSDPSLRALSPADLDRAERIFAFRSGLRAAVDPLLFTALTAAVLTFATPRTTLEGRRLPVFFSLALIGGIPAMVGDALSGAATLLHPAASYRTVGQLVLALPDTLAVFAPGSSIDQLALLGSIDVFTIWSSILIAIGYAALAGASLGRGLFLSFACTLSIVLLQIFA